MVDLRYVIGPVEESEELQRAQDLFNESESLRSNLETLGAYAKEDSTRMDQQALDAIREVKSSALGEPVSLFLNRSGMPGGKWASDAAADALLKGGLEKVLCFEPVTFRLAKGIAKNMRERAGMEPITKSMPQPQDVELQQARLLGKLVNVAKANIQQKLGIG